MEKTYKGETRVMDNGKEATIIEFRDFYDIDVMLCTGEVSMHQQYVDFQRCDSAALGFHKNQTVNEPYEEHLNEEHVDYEVMAAPAILYNYLQTRKEH